MDVEHLSRLGIHNDTIDYYRTNGIQQIHEWQYELLQKYYEQFSSIPTFSSDSRNLVFSAPTKSGKTLISEVFISHYIVQHRVQVMYIVPLVSICKEKTESFQKLFTALRKNSDTHCHESGIINVGGFMAGKSPGISLSDIDLAVCTIEKANSILNFCLNHSHLKFPLIVVDEFHEISDNLRGACLESILTKILYCKSESWNGWCSKILAMGAAFENISKFAKWLNADLFETEFRPVKILENLLVKDQVLHCREIPDSMNVNTISDSLRYYTKDVRDGVHSMFCNILVDPKKSALVFTTTRASCESLCHNLCLFISHKHPQITQSLRSEEIQRFAQGYFKALNCKDVHLAKCLAFGVAFHHAGMTTDEKEMVENAFKQKLIKILFCTSTLSAGINLPVSTVFIKYQLITNDPKKCCPAKLKYLQMIGRAGRSIDNGPTADSIILCDNEKQLKDAKHFITTRVESLRSTIADLSLENWDLEALKRICLDLICIFSFKSFSKLILALKFSLFFHLQDSLLFEQSNCNNIEERLESTCHKVLNWFDANKFVILSQRKYNKDDYIDYDILFDVTFLGKAIQSSALKPTEGLLVYQELRKARKAVSLDGDFHLLYLVTPLTSPELENDIQWVNFLRKLSLLPESILNASKLIGIDEKFVSQLASGKWKSVNNCEVKRAMHVRFYIALCLDRLVEEQNIYEISSLYRVSKGSLQQVQQSACVFAGMLSRLSRSLKWFTMALLFENLQSRLEFGVKNDLLDLMQLQCLDARLARFLFDNGIEKVEQLCHNTCDKNALNRLIEEFVHLYGLLDVEKEASNCNEAIKISKNFPSATISQFCAILTQNATSCLSGQIQTLFIDNIAAKSSESNATRNNLQILGNSIASLNIHQSVVSNLPESDEIFIETNADNIFEYIENSILSKSHSVLIIFVQKFKNHQFKILILDMQMKKLNSLHFGSKTTAAGMSADSKLILLRKLFSCENLTIITLQHVALQQILIPLQIDWIAKTFVPHDLSQFLESNQEISELFSNGDISIDSRSSESIENKLKECDFLTPKVVMIIAKELKKFYFKNSDLNQLLDQNNKFHIILSRLSARGFSVNVTIITNLMQSISTHLNCLAKQIAKSYGLKINVQSNFIESLESLKSILCPSENENTFASSTTNYQRILHVLKFNANNDNLPECIDFLLHKILLESLVEFELSICYSRPDQCNCCVLFWTSNCNSISTNQLLGGGGGIEKWMKEYITGDTKENRPRFQIFYNHFRKMRKAIVPRPGCIIISLKIKKPICIMLELMFYFIGDKKLMDLLYSARNNNDVDEDEDEVCLINLLYKIYCDAAIPMNKNDFARIFNLLFDYAAGFDKLSNDLLQIADILMRISDPFKNFVSCLQNKSGNADQLKSLQGLPIAHPINDHSYKTPCDEEIYHLDYQQSVFLLFKAIKVSMWEVMQKTIIDIKIISHSAHNNALLESRFMNKQIQLILIEPFDLIYDCPEDDCEVFCQQCKSNYTLTINSKPISQNEFYPTVNLQISHGYNLNDMKVL